MKSHVFRKSWPNYLAPLLGLIIWSALLYLSITRYVWLANGLSGFIAGFMEENGVPKYEPAYSFANYIILAAWVILALNLIRTLLKLFWLWTFKITIGDFGISASHGVLPWNKWGRTWEPDQIFGCLYRQSGFLNWLVRHGDLVLTGREGTTNEFVFTRIGRVKKATELVNSIRHRPYN